MDQCLPCFRNQASPANKAALLADKILRGTPAGTIPVSTSDSYFQINYKTAQALGVTVPQNLLNEAAQVIR